MKKIISLILALMLFMSMATVSFATGEQSPTETGSIKITNVSVQKGQDGEYVTPSKYTAYKMFDLESYDADTGKYNYKPTADWMEFFNYTETQQIDGENVTVKVNDYLICNSNGYVEWKTQSGEDVLVRAAELSKLALGYAKEKSLTGISNFSVLNDVTTDETTGLTVASIQLSGIQLGYYLVDSTAGALCGLTTTNPNASFNAKNVPPTIEKQVKEDGIVAGSPWGDTNDADIGQEIQFDLTFTVRDGAENYVLHDKMDPGLDFVKIVEAYHVSDGKEHDLNPLYYNLKNSPTCNKCSFEIEFVGDFYNKMKSGDKIVIIYEARLNENAVYYSAVGNKNEVWLSYGENSETSHDTTVTHTYGFDLAKITTDGKLLEGAKFEIYTSKEGGTPLGFVKVDDNQDTNCEYDTYRLATEKDKTTSNVEICTDLEVTDGCIRIFGLDKSHYYLKETKAPEDYNILSARKEISLERNSFIQLDNNGKVVTNTGFPVVNQAGTILPETGAAGTTMFIALGSVVVIATGLLLVTKKRMSMIK